MQSQVPYLVATKMARIRSPGLFSPSAESFAVAGADAIGTGDSVVPYWSHYLQELVLSALPAWLARSYLLSMHLGFRKRFLAKTQASSLGDAKKKAL